jgi:uncharacterized protein YbjT (DUF2867 family)
VLTDVTAVRSTGLERPCFLRNVREPWDEASEALSYRQETDILGRAIGRQLRFIDEPFDDARARLTKAGQVSD